MRIKYRIKEHPDFFFVEVMNLNTQKYQVINEAYDTAEQARKGLQEYVKRLKDPVIIEEGYVDI